MHCVLGGELEWVEAKVWVVSKRVVYHLNGFSLPLYTRPLRKK